MHVAMPWHLDRFSDLERGCKILAENCAALYTIIIKRYEVQPSLAEGYARMNLTQGTVSRYTTTTGCGESIVGDELIDVSHLRSLLFA